MVDKKISEADVLPTEEKKVVEKEAVKTSDGEKVVLDKAKYEALLNRLDRVEAVANKGRLANYDQKTKQEFGRDAYIGVWDDKFILGWKDLVTNKCEKNPTTGVWQEDQKILLILDGDEEVTIDYQVFVRGFKKEKVEIVSESKDNIGNINFSVSVLSGDSAGKKLDINSKFINP